MIITTYYDDSGYPLGDIYKVDVNEYYVYHYRTDSEYFGFKSEEAAGDFLYDMDYELK